MVLNGTVAQAISARCIIQQYFGKWLWICCNSIEDMLHFYTAVIHHILEYACRVWQTSVIVEYLW